ncbi:SHOCT domain-containing protein [Thermosipho sp. 1074]|uniref:SHOCT domain-containing protein n=1 Tax=Thermosipho sp. 1074 TaxID=1643331 RepID=UPI0009863A05|nr:SHOCT domain-containing protein [Thermosipho sp. 1074]OOC45620.1 hypothetical protein XO08_00905 [Thermosipho sp. 1074]
MYWYHRPFIWHSGWFSWIAPVIGLIVLIFFSFLIYKLIKNSEKHPDFRYEKNFETYDNSLKILNERLAKGEIGEEEYKKLKNLILKH